MGSGSLQTGVHACTGMHAVAEHAGMCAQINGCTHTGWTVTSRIRPPSTAPPLFTQWMAPRTRASSFSSSRSMLGSRGFHLWHRRPPSPLTRTSRSSRFRRRCLYPSSNTWGPWRGSVVARHRKWSNSLRCCVLCDLELSRYMLFANIRL